MVKLYVAVPLAEVPLIKSNSTEKTSLKDFLFFNNKYMSRTRSSSSETTYSQLYLLKRRNSDNSLKLITNEH